MVMVEFLEKEFAKQKPIHPDKKSARFQLYMILWMGIYSLVFLSAVIFYGYTNLIYREAPNSFLISTLLVVLVVGVLFYSFAKNIYVPVVKLEKAIRVLENRGTDFGLGFKNDELYPLSDSLSNMLNQLKDSMDREYSAQILKKQAEINALQSQINPHFLYNTLESIRGQALVEGMDEIADMTEALSALFRYSISKRGNIVTLEDELRNVDNYFTIQQYRFNNKFSIAKILDENEDVLEYKLPKLTIQPIVENAIYHGLETKLGKGNITIRVTATSMRLIINIVDDGIGMEKAKVDYLNESLNLGTDYFPVRDDSITPCIALINVNRRIKLNFGDQYGITVYSTPHVGTDVEIVLPLLKGELDGFQQVRDVA